MIQRWQNIDDITYVLGWFTAGDSEKCSAEEFPVPYAKSFFL
jgi:hypothetical protein